MASNYPPEPPEDFQYDNPKSIGEPNRTNAPPLPYSSPQSSSPSNKKVGCWIAGCLGSLFLGVLLIAAMGFGGYWWLSQQVEKYTDAEPAPMPTVEMEAEEVAELHKEVESFFSRAMPEAGETNADEVAAGDEAPEGEDSNAPLELVLTADQINALLQSNEAFVDRAYIEIKDGRIFAKVTIPTDQIPGGAGRHFNADAEVEVSLQNGVLVIQIVDAKVKGEPLPQEFADELSKQNFAEELYNDAQTAKVLQRFESVEVEEDSIRMRLKNSTELQPTSSMETSSPQSTEGSPSEKSGKLPAGKEEFSKEPINQLELGLPNP